MLRIEPRVTAVIVFPQNVDPSTDSSVRAFLLDLASQLRYTKLFVSIKPGTK